MLAPGFATFGVVSTFWLPLCTGAAVTFLVLGSAFLYGRWRRRHRLSALAAAGFPLGPTTEEEFAEIMASLPAVAVARPLELPEDREFRSADGTERRRANRRWGNPTEVRLRSPLWGDLRGLVLNRSTGGMGIYADKEVPPGTDLEVRAVEAPSSVPAVQAEVRHCLKVGKGFILGCQFSEEVPWNARVWFG